MGTTTQKIFFKEEFILRKKMPRRRAPQANPVPENEGPQQPAEQVPQLTEAMTRKLKRIMGVDNLSISPPITIGVGDGEAKSQRLAELVLVHLGFVAELSAQKEAADRWGEWLWKEWKGTQGTEAIAEWEMIHRLTGIEIIVVSSRNEVKVPASLIFDRAQTMVVAVSAGNYCFVVLSPSRRGEGNIDEFVRQKIQVKETDKRKKRVITLADEAEELETRNEKRGRVDENFRVVEEHPVLESFEEFEKFRKDMRRIKVKNVIEWSEFIGEDILDQVSFIYRAQYKTEIEYDQLSKTEFLTRLEVCVNVYAPTSEQTVGGEPWLHDEPELVPRFIKEFMRFCQKFKGSKLDKVDRLLRNVERTHRGWAEAMYRDIAMFRVEENGDLCLVRAIKKLQELGEAETNKAKAGLQNDETKTEQGKTNERTHSSNGGRGSYEYGGGRGSNGGRGSYENGGGRGGYEYGGGRGGYEYGGSRGGYEYGGGRGDYEYGGSRGSNGSRSSYEYGGARGGYQGRGPSEGTRAGKVDWHPDQQQGHTWGKQRDEHNQGGHNWFPRGTGSNTGGGTGGGASGDARHYAGAMVHRQQRRFDEEEVRTYACYNCGDPNHISPNCPKPKMCAKCGSTKHLRWQCDGSGAGNIAKVEDKVEPAVGQGPVKQYVPTLGTKASTRVPFQPQGPTNNNK